MRALLPILLLAALNASAARPAGSGVLLAGEPIAFDANAAIRFTPKQLSQTNAATRAGLVRWAATPQGRTLLLHFMSGEFEVHVIESLDEPGVGRAPQPGIATFTSLGDHAKRKSYQLILNPSPRNVPEGTVPLPNQPTTTADVMALAWAAEMLHIYFYAQGITLPHHSRADFQEMWRIVAAELGFGSLTHGDGDEDSRPRVRRIGAGSRR